MVLPVELVEGRKKPEELSNPMIFIPKYLKVLTKVDLRGVKKLVPMDFDIYPSQKHYLENRTNRDIIVKSRQTGMSTIIEAIVAHRMFTERFHNASIIAHDEDTAMNLFTTFTRFYENLPENMRPTKDWSSGLKMRFPVLDSYIYIDGANSDHLGLGRSLSMAHLSEVSKWHPSKARMLFTEVSQTVPEGGYLVIESTPHGRGGLFYELYQQAKRGEINYKPFFYPWWWDTTCVRKPKNDMILTVDEEAMVKHYNLTLEQIAFRRVKLAEIGEAFYQEFPENDIDCWLSSDTSVFDGVAVRRYLQQIQKGRDEGALTVWKDVVGGEKYCIGVDGAGGLADGDYTVATVLNIKRNEYVARLRGRIPPDLFSEQLLRLGRRYNDAEIGVEQAQHGKLILRVLIENNYPNLYYYRNYNALDDSIPTEPGWKTSSASKPVMISDLQAAIRSGDLISYSENLMDECSSYMYDNTQGSKYRKAPGKFDDEIDALAIALQIRNQAPILEPGRYKPQSYVKL